MTIRTYSVPAISCEHCKQAIQAEIDKLPEVSFVQVDVGQKTVSVEGTASDLEVREAIEEAGYEVETAVP